MKVTHEKKADGSLEIHLSFEPLECDGLCHDLPGIQGIVDWYAKGPSSEKVFKCTERMIKYGLEMLKADPSVGPVPLKEAELIPIIKSHKDYKDREARDKLPAPE